MLLKRGVAPPRAGASGQPSSGLPHSNRSSALPRAALAALIVAATTEATAAMPRRDDQGLVVSCRIDGLPAPRRAAAQAELCALVVDSARRGAPYPVIVGPALADAPRLDVVGIVAPGGSADGTIAIGARLVRPAETARDARLTATAAPADYADAAAVAAAIETALAILPWRQVRRAPVPHPPRAH